MEACAGSLDERDRRVISLGGSLMGGVEDMGNVWGEDPRRADKPADSLDHLNAVANKQPPVRSLHQGRIKNRGRRTRKG